MSLALSPSRIGFWLAEKASATKGLWIHLCSREEDAAPLKEVVRFAAPELAIFHFPAWNCLPYDRLSPSKDILGSRVQVAHDLAHHPESWPGLLLVSPAGLLQKIPDSEDAQGLTLLQGTTLSRSALLDHLQSFGFTRQDVVRELGDFAVRGSLVDVFSSTHPLPVRLDFFGDTLESLKAFDPFTQMTDPTPVPCLTLAPLSELRLTRSTVSRFQAGYKEAFPSLNLREDPLFRALGRGHTYPGMEHWLPLFADMVPLWKRFPPKASSAESEALRRLDETWTQIEDCYKTRKSFFDRKEAYAPLPPEALYLHPSEAKTILKGQVLTSGLEAQNSETFEGKTLLCSATKGGLERLKKWVEAKNGRFQEVTSLPQFQALSREVWGLGVLPVDKGFSQSDWSLRTEMDLFGSRARPPRTGRRSSDKILSELPAFSVEDYVVHEDHGIGQYKGLEGVVVNGVSHDCLFLCYRDGDKLYVPIENMNLISRYASGDSSATLDKLGLPQWQARKAKIKNRITEIAHYLIKVAAERQNVEGPALASNFSDDFLAFCEKFPYAETEDQLQAIEDTLLDLTQPAPMDRLICGDVGFGKTEVALRAAFLAASAGYQVALIVPTTLLARQHFQTFSKRFASTPYRVTQLSRLVTPKERESALKGLASGEISVVIATHALLRKDLRLANLGLLIVDEEQHFGVAQKEKLKGLKANIHVLTLSATPIPRTLQMALAGVRTMSLITTPPVDRLAVQTFLLPFDSVVIREAIVRELTRGGQVFYVCPRLEHLQKMEPLIRELVPEARITLAHGQMAPTALEDVMSAFEGGRFDVLLSTNIVESGIDIQSANTLIVHRADLFGLAQLYQLRGRVGRGRTQGYAYLTIPHDGQISETALKRLEVIHSLDYLGAGFSVASHDADIRGVGNLVGEEQSGHIREVGIELYQQMLAEAVEDLKTKQTKSTDSLEDSPNTGDAWTPRIQFPGAVSLPENYITDLNLRLGLYRRLTSLKTTEELESFGAELIDRFGPLPLECQNLLTLMHLKKLCQKAWVERLDLGPKGAVLTFYKNTFPHPSHLLDLISKGPFPCRLSSDHKLRLLEDTLSSKGLSRLQGFLGALGRLAGAV
jgi:transcription-repair coupling factor (superfamily II helicase)